MNNWFDIAFEFTLGAEGEYVNDKDDPGGETKWGVTKRDHPELDIKNLTIEKAKEIAYNEYWKAANCDKLIAMGYLLTAIVTFDASFHCGSGRAKTFIQKYLGLNADGIIGQQTIKAIMLEKDLKLAVGVVFEREDYFDQIEIKNSDLLKFEKGWEKRLINIIVDLLFKINK